MTASAFMPPSYDLNSPAIVVLPPFLNEISGLSYDSASGALYAVDDEQGSLFRITLQAEPKVEQWKVGKKMDYEGLVVVHNTAYLLSSPGLIEYFPLSFPVTKTTQVGLGLAGRNEFEILFKDPGADRLLMMCKSCKGETKGNVSVYAFQLATNSFHRDPVASLRIDAIERAAGKKLGAFKPSAANVHPLTGDIYIVSSINKLLVVTDTNFTVKEVFPLQPELFKQPEGLCFSPQGDLYISNEAAGAGPATILHFRPRL